MLSNHASGFKHITFNTIKPIKTLIGDFEWQLISGRLENSGFTPPRTDFEYAGTKIYVPKINQNGETDDWRYLQAIVISYSPKFFKKLDSLLFLKSVPFTLSLIISNGPGRASEEYIGTLQNAASIKTKPGSSQSEDNMKPFDFFR